MQTQTQLSHHHAGALVYTLLRVPHPNQRTLGDSGGPRLTIQAPPGTSLPFSGPPHRLARGLGRGYFLRCSHHQPGQWPPQSSDGTSYTVPTPQGTSLGERFNGASSDKYGWEQGCPAALLDVLSPHLSREDIRSSVLSSDPDCCVFPYPSLFPRGRLPPLHKARVC